MGAYIWLLICVLLLGVELSTMGLTSIWFAIGALFAYFAASMGASLVTQLFVLLIVSCLTLFFTRPLVVKHINMKTTKTNVDELVGKLCVVTEDIDNLQGTGAASLNGQPWMARSKDPEEIISEGEQVKVTEIAGVKLIVERFEN